MSTARSNFGRNLTLTPTRVIVPDSEAELLSAVRNCAEQNVKLHAVGSLHSWSSISDSPEVLLDMRGLNDAEVTRKRGEWVVEAGAGCTIDKILRKLRRKGLTLPTVGAVGKQTIAGALATATHGSGAPSLSHFVKSMRVVCVDDGHGSSGFVDFNELRNPGEFAAARAGLGYAGVVSSVTLWAVPQYMVEESLVLTDSFVEDVLGAVDGFPLQQFALVPYSWEYYVFRRKAWEPSARPSFVQRIRAWWYRVYKFLFVDFSLHLLVKLMARWSKGPFVRRFYSEWFRRVACKDRSYVDRSDRMLMLKHDLFRHLEMEVFVPEAKVEQALTLIRHVTDAFASESFVVENLPEPLRQSLESVPGALDSLVEKRGSFTYHYVINCRRVLPEDTLLAMTVGDQAYYSISLFTFDIGDTDPFEAYCALLAQCTVALHDARLHWGKLFPLAYDEGARSMYSDQRVDAFRRICRRYDPQGLLRNDYATEVLGF